MLWTDSGFKEGFARLAEEIKAGRAAAYFKIFYSEAVTEIEPGVFDGTLNLSNLIHDMYGHKAIELMIELGGTGLDDYVEVDPYEDDDASVPWSEWRSRYVVADSVEQAKKYWARLLDDPERLYVIGVVEINRESGRTGGWRWHKWGPYIGVHTPTCEYLDDEPDIDRVLVVHIYRCNLKKLSDLPTNK